VSQGATFSSPYWPASDGRRFLVNVPEGGAVAVQPLDIVLHWPSTLRPRE
jgi:hypothetical protein